MVESSLVVSLCVGVVCDCTLPYCTYIYIFHYTENIGKIFSFISERIFSHGGLIVEDLRCSLAGEKVEDILMVRLNLPKLEKVEKQLGI